MGLLDNLERRIERAVRKPFSGRGGNLQPVELASALRNATDRAIVSRKDRSIAPNDATFRFGSGAYEKAKEWGTQLAEELCDVLIRHARNQGYTLPADVEVKFVRDPELGENEFEVDTDFTDNEGNPLPYGEHRHREARDHRPEEGAARDSADAGDLASDPPAAPEHAPSNAASNTPSAASAEAPAADRSSAQDGFEEGYADTGLSAAAPAYDEPQEPEYQGILTVAGQRYAIEGESVVIGRSSSADISVEDDGVSRRHIEIIAEDGRYWVRDLGSTNGTHLNGFPLEREEELTDGSVLSLAGTRVSFRLQERPPRSTHQRGARFEPDYPDQDRRGART